MTDFDLVHVVLHNGQDIVSVVYDRLRNIKNLPTWRDNKIDAINFQLETTEIEAYNAGILRTRKTPSSKVVLNERHPEFALVRTTAYDTAETKLFNGGMIHLLHEYLNREFHKKPRTSRDHTLRRVAAQHQINPARRLKTIDNDNERTGAIEGEVSVNDFSLESAAIELNYDFNQSELYHTPIGKHPQDVLKNFERGRRPLLTKANQRLVDLQKPNLEWKLEGVRGVKPEIVYTERFLPLLQVQKKVDFRQFFFHIICEAYKWSFRLPQQQDPVKGGYLALEFGIPKNYEPRLKELMVLIIRDLLQGFDHRVINSDQYEHVKRNYSRMFYNQGLRSARP